MALGNALLIINPAARHGETESLIPVIEQLLLSLPHETVLTAEMGHATTIAAERGADFEAVVAVGGDGTVHEVLNGLMQIPAETRPALGVIPTGSGNDTRRTLGVSTDVAEAVLTLATGVKKRFDVGLVNGIYFNNSFAAGLDAKVTAKAVELKVTTGRSGLWLYLSALLHVLFRDLESFRVKLALDGEDAVDRDTLIVAITQGPTYGGGFRITPDAIPTDGLFEVCLIDPLTLPQALMRLPFVITGHHTNMRVVDISRHHSVKIHSAVPMPAQVDGEVLLSDTYEVSMLPGAIECIVPAEEGR